MWVDAAKEGRQTNWKYVIILIFLALAALGCSWAVENPLEIRLFDFHRDFSAEGTWVTAPCTPETQTCAIGAELYLADGKTLTVLDNDLKTVFLQEFTEEIALYTGDFAVACVPLGKELSILEENSSKILAISGGVDAVFVGQDHFAVITAGSGYLTKTVIYTRDGMEAGQIGLVDAAMVSGAFLPEDSLFAAISYGKDGVWYLGWYTPEGALLQQTAVDAAQCLELRTLGEHLVLRTEDSLLFYEKEGTLIKRVSLGTAEFVSWDSGGNDYLALVVRSRGKYTLKTLSETGQLLGEASLPMEIRDLEVSGNQVLVLDFEALRVYDPLCAIKTTTDLGARAVQIAATDKRIWLLGNGELMELMNQ